MTDLSPRLTSGQIQLFAGSTMLLALVGLIWLSAAPMPRMRTGAANAKVPKVRIIQLPDPLDAKRPVTLREELRRRPDGLYADPDGSFEPAPPKESDRKRGFSITEQSGDPCAPPDTGSGMFTKWNPASPVGVYSLPRDAGVAANGDFDLLIHFHGHDLARLTFVQANVPMVMLGVQRKRGMDWRTQLGGPEAYRHLVDAMEQTLGRVLSREVKARRVALAAWSGGYEAISTLLEQSLDVDADAVILLDGLHVARRPEVAVFQLRPFVVLGHRALKNEVFVFATHSSVVPDGYASTTESTHRWLAALTTRPLRVARTDPPGMPLIHAFSHGSLHVRGYAGGGKPDHCVQLSLYPAALRGLAAWRKARGR
ncbi:MAG TPA: hypothetical protein PKA88_03960 [Polyangiaceae bacterium]|nr:hypothetical protein [Polyangiaceae bacterium]HMR76415.1 hypothetical protein [Polyangiaceae bacterium]